MGLGNRVGVRHESAKTAGVDPSEFYDFQPGQRVMTIDGLPGQVMAVHGGPFAGAEDYEVKLENGLGGGTYTASQLSIAYNTTASVEHTAADDYPELGTILHDRPDIAPNTVLASKRSALDDPPQFTTKNWANPVENPEGHPFNPHYEEHAYPAPDAYLGVPDQTDAEFEEQNRAAQEQNERPWQQGDAHRWRMVNNMGPDYTSGDPIQGLMQEHHLNYSDDHRLTKEPWTPPEHLSPTMRSLNSREFDPFDMLVTAAIDPSFRFHVTATWADVRRKAQRLRAEGKVNIVAATGDGVAANVKGDHHVYQTALTRAPGQRTAVASWECGCKWAAYSWGRSGPWRRFEGRMCSHALALQYEAQSRGMFGRDVTEDKTTPDWLRPRTRVVVEYDRSDKRNISRPAQPRQRDVNRSYRASLHMEAARGTAEDQLSPLDYLLVHAAAQGDDANEVALAVRTAGISPARSIDFDKRLSFEAKDKKRHHSPHAWVPGWGYGWGWCGQCSGEGCGHCAGTGLTGGADGAEPGSSNGASAGGDSGSGGGSTTGQATNPGQLPPNEPQAVPQGPGVWHATRPRDKYENPASAGFATSRDPDSWTAPSTGNAVMASLDDEALFEPSLKEAAFLAPLAPELLGGAAAAGEAGAAAGEAGAGSGLLNTVTKPLINHEIFKGLESHENQDGGQQQDDSQQQAQGPGVSGDDPFYSDAYPTEGWKASSLGELNEKPEPALPTTDGATDEDDGDDDLGTTASATPAAQAVAAASSVEEILAQFQRTAGAGLMSGRGAAGAASAAEGDIAQAARAHLAQRTALKSFSPAEQAELINEGQGVTASNLDRLDIAGTHYEALQALHDADDDDQNWMA